MATILLCLAGCTKEPLDVPDCGCGPITDIRQDEGWIFIQWQDACSGDINTIETMLDLSRWNIGDTVCELQDLDMKH